MLIEEIKKDTNFLAYEQETKYQKIVNVNPLLQKRLTITEEEFSIVLRNSFPVGAGVSIGTLQNERKESRGVSYIQLNEKGRVLYPTIFLYERFNGITVANKATFIINEIEKIYGKKITINQSKLSKLLGVTGGTIINWINENKAPVHYVEKGSVLFDVVEIATWILKNSQMTLLYEYDLEKK